MNIETVLNEIKECEVLLIGIGSEFAGFKEKDITTHELYQNHISKCVDDSWLKACTSYMLKENNMNYIEVYNRLEEIISKKNYFVISSNMDGIIYKSNINQTRIVSVCGNVDVLQCKCKEKLIPGADMYQESLENADFTGYMCEECNTLYEPNIYKAANYNENGYLKKWNLYGKWLQGTLNKRLVILELGVDYNIPTIIRWPFEKMVYINQKSVLYRISERHFQIPQEIKGKGHGISMNSIDFVNALYDIEKR